ncbi:MAG TPA: RdgB/HAM1 family non-canonical purine NTP pyrophosphatase [Anaerohalosphaeraceae bacterium]|jgi:XTP/dITP diphosphohydrolase|nr:RdgB/HAM1 family non-canonical purine NTP pyrophosphatase [Anaerohalosphaeraceae bacterium]HRT49396.1 RdgB/HAM1 family non-canonical purine NTP pyrophosphatase [Anaerohalosphaeraceae bacterium]HRT87389.1 RdgB/HAM1 family non-canonical purine NTP pyrophosphatase [Anaerohalosphaeraceae bacterium]
MSKKILIATTNKGKAAELVTMLGAIDADVQWLTLADFPDVSEVPEDGATFAENARKKALGYARATGLWTLADDSGLVIDALGGAPGIHSARFSGSVDSASRQLLDHRNMAKVLDMMKDTPDEQRSARFVCGICLASPVGILLETEGQLEGIIAHGERGSGGFGYDPIFFLPARNCTVAELNPQEKNAISHRSAAVRKLRPLLISLLAESPLS